MVYYDALWYTVIYWYILAVVLWYTNINVSAVLVGVLPYNSLIIL